MPIELDPIDIGIEPTTADIIKDLEVISKEIDDTLVLCDTKPEEIIKVHIANYDKNMKVVNLKNPTFAAFIGGLKDKTMKKPAEKIVEIKKELESTKVIIQDKITELSAVIKP